MYDIFPQFIFRTPLLPLDQLKPLLKDENALLQSIQNPNIQEAIYIASPVLYKEMLKLLEGKITEKKEKERIIYSVERYISRMSTRCTPFGLFAGCGMGTTGNITDITLHHSIHKVLRLDMYYLHELYHSLVKIPAIKDRIRYFPNTSLYQVGQNLRYIEIIHAKLRKKYRITEVEQSVYIHKILKSSRDGAHVKSLAARLVDKDITEEDAVDFIHELIDAQVIVPELSQSVTGDDLFNRIIKLVESLDIDDLVILDDLKQIQHLLSKVNNENNNLSLYEQILSMIKKTGTAYDEKFILQADTILKTSNASLSPEITDELKSAITFLNRITQSRRNETLRQFQQDFHNRYEEREVPLMEALDPDIGIGYPSKHNNSVSSPLIDDLVLPGQGTSPNEQHFATFQSMLLKRVKNQGSGHMEEIVLTDEDAKELKENWNDLPPTISVMYQIIRSTPNEHLIRLKSCGGSSGANLLSRFAHADDNINQLLADITEKERKITQNVVLAEIVHLPEARVGNILYRPHIRDHELLYMSDSDLPKDKLIYLSDLTLSVRQGRLVIYSKKLKKEIIPRLTNAHNYHNGTMPIYRFLCDMQIQTGKGALYFNWGKQLEQEVSFLPRVRYKNTILSLAIWFIKADEIKAFFSIKEDMRLIEAVTAWRTRIFLPRYVLMPDHDNELFVDWENPLSIRSLFSIIKKRTSLKFTEFLFEPENSVFKSNTGSYTNECISVFYKKLRT